MNSLIVFFILLLSAANSFAIITIKSITGFSFTETIGNSPPTIYGGMAGTCMASSNASTCNTCINATLPTQACNLQSIHPGLVITVFFTSSTSLDNVTVKLKTDAAGVSTDLDSGVFTGTTDFSLKTTWGAVCDADLNFDGSCLPPPATSIKHFLDRGLVIEGDLNKNGSIQDDEKIRASIKFQYLNAAAPTISGQTYSATACTTQKGACGFTLKPGDEKLFIDDFIKAGATGAPTNDQDAPAWQGLVFFSIAGNTASSAQVANNSSPPIIKLYDTNFGLGDSSLAENFQNYQRYCLVMGNMNKAQNIYYFTTANDDTKTCATPSEVVGILEDKSCFISTAAFGSDMAPQVQTFRHFRNKFLLTNDLGKSFVKIYYRLSPPLASFISQNNFLKAVVRVMLTPLLIFSKMALYFGILETIFIFLVLGILLNKVLKTVFHQRKILIGLGILFLAVSLKAEVEPQNKKIQHPGAKEGLVKIKKDGSYIYDVKYELKDESSHIRFGQANQPELTITIQSLDASGKVTGENTLNFEDFYENASNFIIGYDYEWFPWVNKNMLGLQLGVSLMYANGRGRLKIAQGGVNPEAEEKYTFLTVPLSAGAIYRLQWTDQPWIAPYAAGGATYVGLAEKREDKDTPKFAGGIGFYGSGGILINLSKLNAESAFDLNAEYGIGNLWFSLEFKVTEVSNAAFSFKNRYVNGGVAFDF